MAVERMLQVLKSGCKGKCVALSVNCINESFMRDSLHFMINLDSTP